ncbi:MAG: phosphate ABC transporter ATP-binding protein [Rhodospirillaceae bacterium]
MTILPLVLEKIVYQIGGRTLLKCNLEIESGPATVILGPNGAGKSIFLRICHGLLRPSEGRILWLGQRDENTQLKQAMVFQKPVMLRRSVAANIAFGLRLHGFRGEKQDHRVQETLDRIGLQKFAQRAAYSLSGGEQQRLALGRAWALNPDVLFLDEPTANLDPGSTAAVESLIEDIQDAGTKIVMTTHDLGQAKRLGHDIIFLYQGSLLERAPADKFFTEPESPEAKGFMEGALFWSR